MRNPGEAEALLRSLPGGARALDAVAATPGAWVVGGAVRDALLGRAPNELDVVVEAPGTPAALVAALGAELSGEHARFGTGTLTLPEGLTLDLVAARAETYAHPGALPDVRPAELAADLARRDVSVNAIALRPGGVSAVTGPYDPQLRSVPGALGDLRAGVLRVLHDGAFVDDATRLWRVARYAARLGFTLAPSTAALAAAADPETVSGPRHAGELRRTLREPDPRAALTATQALRPALFPPGFAPADAADAVALLPTGEGRADLLWLARAVRPVAAPELSAWTVRLGLTAHERDVVGAGSREAVLHPLRAARTNAEVARAARGAPVELVALAGGANAARWLGELRHRTLAIDGHDLIAAGVAPGPELGRRLGRALDAHLDGDAPGRAEQLVVALAE